MKKNRGFTLIELTVVIFILSFMGFYVIPSIGDRIFRTELKFSLRRMAGNIKEVFSLAAMHKQTYYFVLDFDKNRYWVAIPDSNGELAEEASTHLFHIQFSDKITLLDVATAKEKYSKGENIVLFTPRGLLEKHLIHLRSGDTDYTLIISPLTGQVEIKEGYSELANA